MATIQEALAGLRNPAAMRQAILQRLNINPGQHGANQVGGLGSNADFDREINDLYRQGAETSANLDLQSGQINTNYQRALAQAAMDRDRTLQQIRNGFANRGMSFSGAQVDELARVGSDYDRYVSDIGADRTTNLGDVSRRRLSLIEGLGRGRQTAEQGFGASISEFLQQQAVNAWNSALQANALRSQQAAASRPRQVSSGGGFSGGGGGSFGGSRSSGGNRGSSGSGGFSAPRPPAIAPAAVAPPRPVQYAIPSGNLSYRRPDVRVHTTKRSGGGTTKFR